MITDSPATNPLRWSELAWDCALGQWLTTSGINDRMHRRARSALEFARRASPLHAARLATLPADAPWDAVPVLQRGELMSNFEASLTDRDITREAVEAFIADSDRLGELYDGRYAVWTSSGTSGRQGIFLHDREALTVYESLDMFRFRHLVNPALAATQLWSTERYAMLAATGGHFAGVATVERLRRAYPWLADRMRAISLLQPIETLRAELAEHRPAVIATYPTAALMLADEQAQGRLKLRLRELWTGGETLSDADRARLQRVFGCAVRNGYGASECMSIAWDCEHGRMHVNADWVMLEPIDARGRPVLPDEASFSVLLTNLANRIQPLIRYDLGDSVTWLSQPCPCGCRLPTIRIEGRRDDVLHLPGKDQPVALLPLVLATALEEHAAVFDYQVLQTGATQLQLRLGEVDPTAAQRAQAALQALLAHLGVRGVTIDCVADAPVRSSASGKLRRVLALGQRSG